MLVEQSSSSYLKFDASASFIISHSLYEYLISMMKCFHGPLSGILHKLN